MSNATLGTFLTAKLIPLVKPLHSKTQWCREHHIQPNLFGLYMQDKRAIPEKDVPRIAAALGIRQGSEDYREFVRLADEARLRSKRSISSLVERLEKEASERDAQLAAQAAQLAAQAEIAESLRRLLGQILTEARKLGVKLPRDLQKIAKEHGL